MSPETLFAAPVIETVPGADFAPELAGIETATQLAGIEAATEYSEFMAAQAQVLGILFSHYVRAEQGSAFSNQLQRAMVGTAVVSEVVSAYHPGAIAAAEAAQKRTLEGLDFDPDDDDDYEETYGGAQ